MKFYTLLGATLLAFAIAACEKEDMSPKDPDIPEVVLQQITEDLADAENITGFVEAFETLELNTEDIETGITIFAPTDDALAGSNTDNGRIARSASDTTELTEDLLKDHIVKGVIGAAGLQNGDTLITLNGKALLVTVDGDAVRVNGVLLSEKDVATNAKYVVHTVEQLLSNTTPQDTAATPNTATVEITVWNGALWTPENPKGEVEAGATVSLYASREDYAQGNAAAYTAETDAEGKAVFIDLEAAKTYYVVAQKSDMSNIFYKTQQPENGVYLGLLADGIFQSESEIWEAAQQPAALPGNFRWTDMNADGLINGDDYVAVPSKSIEAVSNQTMKIEITIGYDDNDLTGPVTSGAEALHLLEIIAYDGWGRGELARLQEYFVQIDGTLSDDVSCDTGGCFGTDLDAFAFNSDNLEILNLWNKAYAIIGMLNKLLRDVPELTFPEKVEVMAQAKGVRAYIYLQLVTYFGDVPLNTTDMILGESVERTPASEVYEQIVMDLQEAAEALPIEWPAGEKHKLNANAAWTLLAKAALWNKDYEAAAEYTTQVLSSARYELVPRDSIFTHPYNSEIIWDFSYDEGFPRKFYFFDRPFCPALRLAEVYLMHAEAKFALNIPEDGINSLNELRNRMGLAPVSYFPDESNEALRTTWKEAMPREGSRYANLVRWEKATEVLGPLGFQPHHALLPIPQRFIEEYFNIVQNPGY